MIYWTHYLFGVGWYIPTSTLIILERISQYFIRVPYVLECTISKRCLRYWQTRTHCCGHSVAHDVSWAAQTGKHLLRTQNVSEQNKKHFLCPGHKICVRNKCCASGQTGKHLCRQQCVGNNVSSFARAFLVSGLLEAINTQIVLLHVYQHLKLYQSWF